MQNPSEDSQNDTDAADRALLARIAEHRDAAAMETIYVRYRPRLVGFLRRLTRDDELIEEAYNDVMVLVWEKAHQYQARSKVSSWIFSIAYRACLRMVKKQNRRDTFLELVGQDTPDIVEEAEDTSENFDHINAAIQNYRLNTGLVVELCYYEGYSTEEIGEIVECPANTVKTRLHHARRKIRELLANAGVSHEFTERQA